MNFIQKMNVSRKIEILIFVAIGFIAAGLRLYHLGYYSLWMDEVFQVRSQSRVNDMGELIYYAAQQSQPPLDYIFGWISSNFISFSEFTVRFPSFLFGTGTVLVSFLFVRRLFDVWTAVLSSLWLALSTVLIYFSQEARPYSIFLFFLMILLIVLFQTIESKGERFKSWFIFILIASLTLLTRGMAPVTVLIALNLAFTVAMLIYYAEERIFVFPFTLKVWRNLIISTMLFRVVLFAILS